MELKIKAPKGSYALRAFDESGRQIFYTSSRLGGIKTEQGLLTCTIPDAAVSYELKDIEQHKIIKSAKVKEEPSDGKK